MTDYKDRMIQAALLNAAVYEEIEADECALRQAMGVVIFSSIAAGVGTIQKIGFGGVLIGTIFALLGWYIWAYMIYLIGTKILPEQQTRSTHGELLRAIGFSSAPGLLRVLGVVPGLLGIVYVGTGIWMLIAMVFAVKRALDYQSTLRAIAVCIIGWIIQGAVVIILLSLFGRYLQAPVPT
jgi:hypothetical protein